MKMKKAISLVILAVLFWTAQAWATWTLTPSIVGRAGHYFVWKVLCTSDGNALTATDLVPLMSGPLFTQVKGASHMIMAVSPGTGGVAPNTTIDVTLNDTNGAGFYFVHTGYSNSADTNGIALSEDFTQYPTVLDKLYLTLNDIGDTGDQVTLFFFCWIE